MPPTTTGKQEAEAVFQSISQLEKAGNQPWALIAMAVAAYLLALWQIEIVLAIGVVFSVWMFAQAWLSTGSIRIDPDGAFTSYGELQPASRWVFAPAGAGLGAISLLALLPWRIPAAVVLGSGLAVWVAIDAFRSFSRRSAPAGPPFNTYSALSSAESRHGGYLFSACAHAMLCFLPALAALVAVWLTPPEREPPVKPPKIVVLNLRPPEPVKDQKKQLPPPNAQKVASHQPERRPEPIDMGKLDLTRMAVEFAADRDQALPSVLAGYGAHVAFVDNTDTEDYLHGKSTFLPSEYVYSAVDWLPVGRTGIPTDISSDYILLLQNPEYCAPIARLKLALGPAGAGLQVFLVFPRVSRGFEQQLNSAVTNQAQKQAADLHGSIISRVLLAFSAENPGIAVQHVESVAAPPNASN